MASVGTDSHDPSASHAAMLPATDLRVLRVVAAGDEGLPADVAQLSYELHETGMRHQLLVLVGRGERAHLSHDDGHGHPPGWRALRRLGTLARRAARPGTPPTPGANGADDDAQAPPRAEAAATPVAVEGGDSRVDVIALDPPPGRLASLAAAAALPAVTAASEHTDLVHVHYRRESSLLLLGLVVARVRRIPLVVTMYGSQRYGQCTGTVPELLARSARGWIEWHVMRGADAVVVGSRRLEQRLAGDAVNPDKVCVMGAVAAAAGEPTAAAVARDDEPQPWSAAALQLLYVYGRALEHASARARLTPRLRDVTAAGPTMVFPLQSRRDSETARAVAAFSARLERAATLRRWRRASMLASPAPRDGGIVPITPLGPDIDAPPPDDSGRTHATT